MGTSPGLKPFIARRPLRTCFQRTTRCVRSGCMTVNAVFIPKTPRRVYQKSCQPQSEGPHPGLRLLIHERRKALSGEHRHVVESRAGGRRLFRVPAERRRRALFQVKDHRQTAVQIRTHDGVPVVEHGKDTLLFPALAPCAIEMFARQWVGQEGERGTSALAVAETNVAGRAPAPASAVSTRVSAPIESTYAPWRTSCLRNRSRARFKRVRKVTGCSVSRSEISSSERSSRWKSTSGCR